MIRRVTILTAGHVSTTPRMVKAADALHEVGYTVRIVSTEHVDWAMDVSRQLVKTRGWRWQSVEWRSHTSPWLYQKSRVRHKLSRSLAATIDPSHLPLGLLSRASCRVAPELVRVAVAEPADLIYAGTAGGLAVAAIVARRMGLPYALDLEDFHTGELIEAPQNNAACSLMKAVEQRVLSGAAFLTTSSEPIAAEYNRLYSVTPHVIHNVFPLPQREPDFTPSVHRPLTLFWFSQVVGPNRGLEDVISAATQLARPIHIRLLGHAYPDYLSRLKALAGKQVVIEHIPPVSPDRIDEEARRADVGLATEQTTPLNRDLCITNKIFTYMLAGLAIAATNTQGQQLILSQEPAAGFLYVPGDTDSLATKLQKWADDPMALVAAKRASWEAAKRRWHWEHPLERGTLLKAVERVIGKP